MTRKKYTIKKPPQFTRDHRLACIVVEIVLLLFVYNTFSQKFDNFMINQRV